MCVVCVCVCVCGIIQYFVLKLVMYHALVSALSVLRTLHITVFKPQHYFFANVFYFYHYYY